jgi:hypothetical protein
VGRLIDISMYGVFIAPIHGSGIGDEVQVVATLDDGAEVCLSGTVVNLRDGGIAVRCRPTHDQDLLLWIHLLLGELAKSPRFADLDPFGPLFR